MWFRYVLLFLLFCIFLFLCYIEADFMSNTWSVQSVFYDHIMKKKLCDFKISPHDLCLKLLQSGHTHAWVIRDATTDLTRNYVNLLSRTGFRLSNKFYNLGFESGHNTLNFFITLRTYRIFQVYMQIQFYGSIK